MPVNKAARIRYEIIDECLRNNLCKWSVESLKEKVNEVLWTKHEITGVAERTIDKDLKAMQAIYGAPIVSKQEGRAVYYTYEYEFSIHTLPVEEVDLLKLNQAVHLLKQIKGFTISGEIAVIVNKIENKIKIETNTTAVIAFENPPAPKGIDFLEDIYIAILTKKVLKICYQSFKQAQSQDWLIHPYLLKEYNNRWFLLGLYDSNKIIGIYALDRMHSVKVSSLQYVENTTLNADDYFKNIIGVTLPANAVIETVELEFSASRAPYVVTKHLHHSQKIISQAENGNMVVQLSVIPNPELESLILGFGCDVKVLQPEWLKVKMISTTERMMKCYEES